MLSPKIVTPVVGSVIIHKCINIIWESPPFGTVDKFVIQVGRNSIYDLTSVIDVEVGNLLTSRAIHIPSGTSMLNISVWVKINSSWAVDKQRYAVKLGVDQLNVKENIDIEDYDEDFFTQHI